MAAPGRAGAFVGLLLLAACAGRLVHLDADPWLPTWIGYVVDEGRWIETARNLALFGDADVDGLSRLHLFMSPGFQAVDYLVFLGFGVSFSSARWFTAITGVLVVVTVYLVMRRHVTRPALLFGVVVLGFETNVFGLSRLALPEMPAALATLLAFFVLVRGRTTPWSSALAGLIAAGAVAMKATSLPVLLIFPVIALIVPRELPVRRRVERSAAFAAGFVLPIAAGIAGLYAFGRLEADVVREVARSLHGFVAWAGPYGVVSRFFDAAELEARNLLLLGVWFCSWLWLYRRSETPSAARDLYLASGVWAGWWLFTWSANVYLPGRWVVHFIVPATIHIMAGLSLGGRDTAAKIAASLRRRDRITRAAVASWLVLPSAIVLASLAVGIAGASGWNGDRLSERIAIVAVVTGFLALIASLWCADERGVTAFRWFPVAMALLWLTGRELALLGEFWGFDSFGRVAIWSLVAGAAAALCFALAPRVQERPEAFGSAASIALAAIFVWQAAPPILLPTYSLRDASRDLARHLPMAGPIRTVTAASLFLENRIRYRELRRDDLEIDGLVIFEPGPTAQAFLDSERAAKLVRVQAYPLTIHPRYRAPGGELGAPIVGIYRAK